jgi:flagellar protein FliO/FliZ
MFETLFGLAARFVLAFLISLGLILATAWVVLRFGKRRSESANTRARLAIVDRASVDESRQLILLRRDNDEHLLMIGGRTNVVVEANIVRAAREVMQAPDPAAAEPLRRAIPAPSVRPATAAASVDQSLPELAHRIDVLLRSPSPSPKQAPTAEAAPTPPSRALAPRPGEARAGFKLDQSKALYEELASWLDRPTKN